MTDQHGQSGNGEERVGVYVCHCGTNISDTVDVADVRAWAEDKLKKKYYDRDME